jgi:hypothetical protein
MTPPQTRPLTPALLFVIVGSLAMAVAMPYVRREDWIGWIAFGTIVVFAIGLWVLLIRGFVRELRARWRENDASRK